MAAAASAALPLFAKTPTRIGRSRLSAISDEIAATPAEALAFAKKYGLEWLELRNVPGAKTPYFFMSEAELKPVAKEFSDHGIKISFLNTNLLKFGLPGTEPLRKNETAEARAKRLPREQAQFDRRMDDLQKCIRAAQVLGVRRHPFTRPEHAARHVLIDVSPDLPLFQYWRDAPGGGDLPFAGIRRFNSLAAIHRTVLAGDGVAVLPHYFVAPSLARGRLRRLFPRVRLLDDYFRLVYRRDDHRVATFRALAAHFLRQPLR